VVNLYPLDGEILGRFILSSCPVVELDIAAIGSELLLIIFYPDNSTGRKKDHANQEG